MSPGPLDDALVRARLRMLDEAIQNLRRHRGQPAEVLRTDLDEQWAVVRGLQLCAQVVLDVSTHIAASAGHDVPDYAAAVDAVGRLGVLTAEQSPRLRGIAGFRNVLVHAYAELDLDVVHQVLNDRLEELAAFGTSVEAYLDRNS